MRKYKTNCSKTVLYKNLSTLWLLGYFKASGTVASFATLPFVILLKYFNLLRYNSSQLAAYLVSKACFGVNAIFTNEIFYLSSVILITVFSFYVLHSSLHLFNEKDPKSVVIDEFCGQLVAFLFVDINIFSLIFLFLAFRFFDVIKPFGIKQIEKMSGACGVMLDDIIAGIYANILYWALVCILYFLN